MHAYLLDLRQRILADCDRGLSTRVVATKFNILFWLLVVRGKSAHNYGASYAPRR